MKLYHMPGTASLAARIALAELAMEYTPVQVRLKSKRTEHGAEFLDINGKGYVPVLELDDGTRLSETSVILQYLADQRPDAGLFPPAPSFDRYRVLEWLSFIGSEVHKQFSPLFTPGISPEWREACLAKLSGRLSWTDGQLAQAEWLIGGRMTIADIYLFAVINWVRWVPELELGSWPNLRALHERASRRPDVASVLQLDGIG